MRIAVIGAGGVGAPFGAALHRAGEDVWFLARGRHLAAMRDRDLRIVGARGDTGLMRMQATDRLEAIGPVAVVLLTVKQWDVEEVGPGLASLIVPHTVVVTLQNGIDAPRQVAEAVGAAHIAAGTCFVNAGVAEPGRVVQHSRAQQIVAGMLAGAASPTLEQFGAACGRADIEFERSEAPLEALWEKFLQVVLTSAMTALLRRPIGAVRGDVDSWRMFLQILDETVAVGRATGICIPPAVVERRLAYVRNMPYEATASMAKDRLAGRRLELPWLSGRVAELGRRYGIPTPANDFVTVALRPFMLGDGVRVA